MTDRADISRVEGHNIGFYFELAERGDDQIMGNPAIRYLDRGIALRRSERRGIERGTGFATARSAGTYSRGTARYVRPLVLLDARVAQIGAPFFPRRSDRRCSDRDVREA